MESAFSKADTVSNANVVWHQAANEPTFRCPDELGWQPQNSMPVDAILKSLKKGELMT
ncbi:hypothetical protein JHK82_022837 [Glycine max]|nr:hypothetical protein JHK82_022837 [Glycine max]